MIFLGLAIVFIVIGIRQYKSIPMCCDFKYAWKKWFIILICFISTTLLLFFSIIGGTEGNTNIINKGSMVGKRQNETTYELIDEKGNIYYVEDGKVEVNSKYMPNYVVIVGDYEKPFVQASRTEMKMTVWSLALVDRIENRLYIPQDMPIE